MVSTSPDAGGPIRAGVVVDSALALAIGPHASRALGALVAGAVAFPVAWLEDHAQRIRDKTAARSLITRATAEKLAAEYSSDPNFLDRTAAAVLGREFQRQSSIEQIVAIAADDLHQVPPDADGPIDDDFVGLFREYASKASTPSLRKLFARVLAGEIRAPGEFSPQTLHVLSLLDPGSARAVSDALAWVVDRRWIPLGGELREDDSRECLEVLREIGLVRSPELIDLAMPGRGVELDVIGHRLRVLSKTRYPLSVCAYPLTRVGQDFTKVVEVSATGNEPSLLGFAIYDSQEGVVQLVESAPLSSIKSGRSIPWTIVAGKKSNPQ